MKIGNLEIRYRAMPSPMASVTDIVFRRLVDEIGGAGFMVTELISAEALRRSQSRTLEMTAGFRGKTPQFIQLFGSTPEQFTEAGKYIENETEYNGIDINMGCPAPKVVRKGAGAALLNDPQRAGEIVLALKHAVKLPVTVKIRLGFSRVNVFEMVKILQEQGADAIAVHFRLRSEGYSGDAHWEYAGRLKEMLKIPLIGNGNILTPEQGREKLGIVDGVLIGRGAVRNPLIFRQIAGEDAGDFSMERVIRRLLELIGEHFRPDLQAPRVKAVARFLFSGRQQSKRVRSQVYAARTMEEIVQILAEANLEDFFRGHGRDGNGAACFFDENEL